MVGAQKSSKNKQQLLNYKWVPQDLTYFDVVGITGEDDTPGTSDLQGQGLRSQSDGKPYDQLISTKKLVSSISGFWGTISQPLSVLETKNVRNSHHTNVTHPSSLDKLLLESCVSGSECKQNSNVKDPKPSTSPSEILFPYANIALAHNFLTKIGSRFDGLRENEDYKLSNVSYGYGDNFVYRKVMPNSPLPVQPSKDYGLITPGFSCDLIRMYGYVSNFPFFGSKNVTVESLETLVKCEEERHEIKRTTSEALGGKPGFEEDHLPTISNSVQHSSTSETMRSKSSPLCAAYFVGEKEKDEQFSVSELSDSCLLSDHHGNISQWRGKQSCKSFQKVVSYSDVSLDKEKNVFLKNGECLSGTSKLLDLSSCKINNYFPVSERHALAGALAGIFVSLWLHPVDTVKTVTQSSRINQTSISHVLRKILSEKGIAGLYRGIGSNLVSSAPISAVYTFTYESVKGSLLPLLPKEYHSFAHCTAGGCASIATSFIFTPSERIKQQMQVGSHYQNCWYSLIGIIKKGGLSSLYAGWGAVLCRNIPHSIIKFYTYESLKQWAFSSEQNYLHQSTLQTLIFGGVAGSTAALFTTPFDVIKTRLQTQMPGSVKVYDGVFHAFREIATREGVRSLYRGLTPRLVMYMSQGALFFASYEFFKRLFSLEVQSIDGQNSVTQFNTEEADPLVKVA